MKSDRKAIGRESSRLASTEVIVWLDKHAVQDEFHISSTTLYNWRHKYELPCYPLDNKIYFKRSDLDQLIESRRLIVKKKK